MDAAMRMFQNTVRLMNSPETVVGKARPKKREWAEARAGGAVTLKTHPLGGVHASALGVRGEG